MVRGTPPNRKGGCAACCGKFGIAIAYSIVTMEKIMLNKTQNNLDFLVEKLASILEEKNIANFIMNKASEMAKLEIEKRGMNE